MDACEQGRICTLNRDEMGDRVEAWKSLNRACLVSQSEDCQGLTLVYKLSEQSERMLEKLIRLEKVCCGDGGMHFQVSKQEDALTLRVRLSEAIQGRQEAAQILSVFASK